MINPFIEQTVYVFDAMLGWNMQRKSCSLKRTFSPEFDVCGLVELNGGRHGAVALGGSRRLAGRVASCLLGGDCEHRDADVADCIGELANTVAGRASASLREHQVRIGLPSVVFGTTAPRCIACEAPTVDVLFTSWDEEVWLEISLG